MPYQTNRYYTPQRQSQNRQSQQTPPRKPTRFKRGFIKIIICLLVVLSAYGGITYTVNAVQEHNRVVKEQKLSDALTNAITPIINAHPDEKIGVAVYDPSTSKLRTYGQSSPFPAASTAKVITALAYYHLVELGKLDLDHSLGAFNAEYQLQQMINQSNNESWEMLVQEMGRPYLQEYSRSIGSDYKVSDNTISPGSMAKVLSDLQGGKLLNQTHTSELLGYMQRTNVEELIPAGTPDGVTVYHKYGLLDGTLHDASVLQKDSTSYGFTIYTQNTDDSDDAARTKTIQQITEAASNVLFD